MVNLFHTDAYTADAILNILEDIWLKTLAENSDCRGGPMDLIKFSTINISYYKFIKAFFAKTLERLIPLSFFLPEFALYLLQSNLASKT